MHLHEFLAKDLLAKLGVRIPKGRVAASAEEAEAVARDLVLPRYAVKAQILAGDRLANGGIRFANSAKDVRAAAADLIGRRLVTRQTDARGEMVRRVYIEEMIDVGARFFVAAVLDRSAGAIVLLARATPVEESETETGPAGKVERVTVRLTANGPAAEFAALASKIAPDAALAAKLAALFAILATAVVEFDATMIEINALGLHVDGYLIAMDAKMTIDDHALFRHPEFAALQQAHTDEDGDPKELAADRYHVNYIGMDGNIGLAVNGAGLALATLDMLIDAGARPANFMDVRTTATTFDIASAFDLLLSNRAVRAILLNVHGGGMQRCDTIVEGMAISMRRNGRVPPLVIRLAGNNADFARERLKAFGIKFIEGATIAEAVERVVALAKKEAA